MPHKPSGVAPALLTLQQAADRLQVSKTAIYRLINRGDLAVTDVATGVGARGRSQSRISEASLADFIQRRTRTSKPRAVKAAS